MESKKLAATATQVDFADSPYAYFEILNPSGSGKDSSNHNHIRFHQSNLGQGSLISKSYDRTVKGNIFSMMKSTPKSSIEFINPLPTLSYQNCIVFQMQSYDDMNISLELVIIDDKGHRKRIYMSSSFHHFESNELHAKIPWNQPYRNTWTNLIFPLDYVVSACFPRCMMTKLESFQLNPCCKIRKIFMIPHELLKLNKDNYNNNSIKIPIALGFPPSVDHQTVVFQVHQDLAEVTSTIKSSSTSSAAAKKTSLSSKSTAKTAVPDDIINKLHQRFLKIDSLSGASNKDLVDKHAPPQQLHVAEDLKLLKKRSRRLKPSVSPIKTNIHGDIDDDHHLASYDTDHQAAADMIELPPAPMIPPASSSSGTNSLGSTMRMRMSKTMIHAGEASIHHDDHLASSIRSTRSYAHPPHPPESNIISSTMSNPSPPPILDDLIDDVNDHHDDNHDDEYDEQHHIVDDHDDMMNFYHHRKATLEQLVCALGEVDDINVYDMHGCGIMEVMGTLLTVEVGYVKEYGIASFHADVHHILTPTYA